MQSWIHVLEWRAAVDGARLAYVDDTGDSVTFAELARRVERIAGGWQESGIAEGDRVLLVARNGVAFLVHLLAIVRAGAVPTLLNWRLSSAEFNSLAAMFEPSAVIAHAEFTASLDAALDDAGWPSLQRVVIDPDSRAGGVLDPLARSVWRPASALDADPKVRPRLEPDAVFAMLHTSGTTGRPKGIPLRHGSTIMSLLQNSAETEVMHVGTRHLRYAPMFHWAGLGGSLLGILTGGEVHLMTAFDVGRMIDLLERHRIECTNATPVVMRRMVDEVRSRSPRPDLSALKECWYGTAPFSPDLLDDALETLGCRFRQNYGMTESQSPVSRMRPEDHVKGSPRLASAGRLLPHWDARVVDTSTGSDVPAGELGELWIRGASLFTGYWRAPELTAEVMVDGWYRTGDIVRIDGDGFVYIVDRARDLIISGGENLYPAEIEHVLARHDDVAEVAVVGVPSARWGESAHAVVVPRADDHASSDELIAFCRERLAHFKCPVSVDFVASLPRNETGKVLRRVLRAPFWDNLARDVN